MARDGEIQNRVMLDAVANALDIGGVRRYPIAMNMDSVQVVLNVSQWASKPMFISNGSNSGYFPTSTLTVGVNIIGSSSVDSLITTNSGGIIAADPLREARVMSLAATVDYSAAGATADAGIRLEGNFILKDPKGGSLSFPLRIDFAEVQNCSPNAFPFTFPSGIFMQGNSITRAARDSAGLMWDGYIPPGWSCWFSMNRQLGTGYFPTLTSMSTYFSVATRLASGDWKA